MANQIILNLPAAIALTGQEQLWANQNGTDVRLTSGQIAALAVVGGAIAIEPVTVTGLNAFAPLTYAPTTAFIVLCINNASVFFNVGAQAAFTVAGKNLTWISTSYNVQTSDNVVAIYTH